MKKSFPLHVPEKEDSRVVEAIKLTLTKYVKRERRKKLPEGADFWDFNCKVGSESETATAIPLPDLPKALDALAHAGGSEVYVEILACPGYRPKKTFQSPYPEQNS